jgi:hypothetical protein
MILSFKIIDFHAKIQTFFQTDKKCQCFSTIGGHKGGGSGTHIATETLVGMPSEEDMPTTMLSHDEYDVGILEGASLLPPERPGCKLIKIIQLMNYAFYCLTNISVLDSC